MSKACRLLAIAVTKCRYTGAPGISLGQYQLTASWKAMKAQQLKLTSKPLDLVLTLRVNRATKMSRVRQGVSEYRSHSLRQAVEIVDFIQQNSDAAASWKYGVSQPGPRSKTYTATDTCSCDLL